MAEYAKLSDEELDRLVAQKMGQQKTADYDQMSDEELDRLVAEKAEASSRPGQAALEGFGQSATLGYLPQLQAAASKPLQAVYEFATGTDLPDETYTESRDAFIKRGQRLAEENPKAYLGGTVAGALATPGTASLKATGTLGKLALAAGTGAATGALYNPGDVEGELSGLQLKERGQQALIGAGTGALGQGLIGAGGKAMQAWASKGKGLEKASNKMALTAAGAKTSELKKLYDKKTAEKIGKFIKDEGLVGVGSTVDSTLEGAQGIMKEVGPQISAIYEKGKNSVLSPTKIANELDDMFTKELKGKAGGRRILAAVQGELENLKDLGQNAKLEDVLEFRKGIDDLINYDKAIRDLPGAQQALLKMRNHLRDKLEEELSKVDGADVNKLKELNKRYWGAAEVESIGRRAVAREESKMILGLPELIVGGAAGGASAVNSAIEGRPEDMLMSLGKGALVGAAVKGARKFGPGITTALSSGTGKALQLDPTKFPAKALSEGLKQVPSGLIGTISERVRRRKPGLINKER